MNQRYPRTNQNEYSKPTRGGIRSRTPLWSSANRTFASRSSRWNALTLNPTAPVNMLNESDEKAIFGNGLAVERVKRLRAEALGVDDVAANHIEGQRHPPVRADFGADRIAHAVGEVGRLAGGRVARQDARAVPLVADVHVGREALPRGR